MSNISNLPPYTLLFTGFVVGFTCGWVARMIYRWYRRRRHRLFYGD